MKWQIYFWFFILLIIIIGVIYMPKKENYLILYDKNLHNVRKNKMEESNSNKPSTNIFISPLKGNNEINTNRYRKSKSSSSMLLSPRTDENILTMKSMI